LSYLNIYPEKLENYKEAIRSVELNALTIAHLLDYNLCVVTHTEDEIFMYLSLEERLYKIYGKISRDAQLHLLINTL